MIRLSCSRPAAGELGYSTWDLVAYSNLAKVNETDLRYKLFAGPAEMVIGDVRFISKGRLTTFIDLAIGIRWVLEQISNGLDAALGFTESAQVIHFRTKGKEISVSFPSKSLEATVGRAELLIACSDFLKAVHELVVDGFPGLNANPVIQKIIENIDSYAVE